MKIKVAEATNIQLDWLVAKCLYGYGADGLTTRYSTDWTQGGPIIEREKIKVDPRSGNWECTIWNAPRIQNPSYGPTPLIAAMRCYVASKLGDEVEIPDELM